MAEWSDLPSWENYAHKLEAERDQLKDELRDALTENDKLRRALAERDRWKETARLYAVNAADHEAERDRLREKNEKLKQALTDLDQILKERWAGSA